MVIIPYSLLGLFRSNHGATIMLLSLLNFKEVRNRQNQLIGRMLPEVDLFYIIRHTLKGYKKKVLVIHFLMMVAQKTKMPTNLRVQSPAQEIQISCTIKEILNRWVSSFTTRDKIYSSVRTLIQNQKTIKLMVLILNIM